MHSPFALSLLIPAADLGTEQVTAILLHAHRIILGTDTGALLVFDLAAASTSSAPPAAQLVARHAGFAKKRIEQLAVMKELNALVCLAGGDVTLHSLPTFSPLSSFAAQTRTAASLFVLSTSIHFAARAAAAAVPEIHTTLAVACRRKLLLFNWVDGTSRASQEVGLPHQIRATSFCEGSQGRKLVAGFSTGEYGYISLPGLATTGRDAKEMPSLGELFQPPIPTSTLALLPPPPSAAPSALAALGSYGERLGGIAKATGGLAKATGNVMGLGGLSLGTKKVEKNLVVAIPKGAEKGKHVEGQGNGSERAWLWGREWGWDDDAVDGEVMVVRENLALPLSSLGARAATPSTTSLIAYETPPDELLVLPPYVVALLPAPPVLSPPPSTTHRAARSPGPGPSLVVHSVEMLSSIQTLALPTATRSPSVSEIGIVTAIQETSTVARYLTVASSSSQPPILLLTVQSRTPSVQAPSEVEQAIWIVSMKSWEMQIAELGQLGAWDEAMQLVRRSGPAGGEISSATLRRLSILRARSLFDARLFDLAVNAFISLELTPAKVISLYPSRISGRLFVEPDAVEEIFGGRAQADVVAAMSEAAQTAKEKKEREEEAESKRAREMDEDAASIKSAPNSVGRRMGSSSGWLRERESKPEGVAGTLQEIAAASAADLAQQEKAQAKSDEHNFSRSVDVLIRYLTDRRQKCAKAIAAILPSARPLASTVLPAATASELRELPDLPLEGLKPDQLARVAQVVDTALFKSYLATKPVMVGPLCRIENWCEVGEVEGLLLSAEKFLELLDLYNGKHMHNQAVKLLRKMSEDEDDPEDKVEPTVRYLQKLGSDHLDLIFESSEWIFEVDQSAGLEIFVADLEEVESLPRHATMAHLERIGPRVCMRYLEHIIHTLGEEGSEFHEKLIELYLAAVQAHPKPDTPAFEEDYQKMLDFLEASTSYRADRILGRLPSEALYEARALLLGRLGRHEGALQIYVYQLDDHATAEDYCSRVYEGIPAMRPTIFHLLLRIYLRPRINHPLLFTPALALISNHAASIDPIEVFDLLPPLVALGDIKTFLEKTLRKSHEKAREGQVLRGIARSQMDANSQTVVELEERRVKITDSRLCPQCHKRLGNSVIAIHSPNGEVTHYQCREKFQESRVR